MQSSENYIKDKFTWCISTYATKLQKSGYNISKIRPCIFNSNCYNFHSIDEFKLKPHIKHWNKMSQELSHIQRGKNHLTTSRSWHHSNDQ